MCGIAGFIGKTENWKDEIKGMCNRIAHRGPDAFGIWSDENTAVVLGHRRLSILDLSEMGRQPMKSHDERFVVSYNGEIYNFSTIAKELQKQNTTFKTGTDTEVLIEAIAKWGIKRTLLKVRGMFAIAIYDRAQKELILARDRMGEKPLYYGYAAGKFVFASDLASIEQLQGFDNNICEEALWIFMHYGYIPAPYSIYDKIRKLDPGSILVVGEDGEVKQQEWYWKIGDIAQKGQANKFGGSEEEASEELERKLKEVIKMQMLADVPVGAFLSAGIDSSTIVSLLKEVSSQPVKTFTIGVNDESYNEAKQASKIAEILGTDHTEMYITEGEAQKIVPKLKYYYSEPFADSSQIPTMLVSELAKKRVTVALTGDGGDELFAGYSYYECIKNNWDIVSRVPALCRKIVDISFECVPFMRRVPQIKKLEFLRCNSPEQLYQWDWEHTCNKYKIFNCRGKKHNNIQSGIFEELEHNLMLMDMKMYLPDDILTKVDRASMAFSLETRIPFLDSQIIEFAWSLPFEYKKNDSEKKRILRNVLYKYIPQDIINRPKTGFSIPLDKWLKQPELKEWLMSIVEVTIDQEIGVFNKIGIQKLLRDYYQKDIWSPVIWYLAMYSDWKSERR